MKLKVLLCLLLANLLTLLTFVVCGSPKMGSIIGHVFYQQINKEENREPMENVKIILCEVNKDKKVLEGPIVADIDANQVRKIGILRAEPSAITDSDGRFILSEVPAGTYLILFHLWPDELGEIGDEWDGICLTEARVDSSGQKICSSGKSDFWEKGGIIVGVGNWSSKEGWTITNGNVCSESLGFCFSVRDGGPVPLVEVKPNSTVEALLIAHFKPEERH